VIPPKPLTDEEIVRIEHDLRGNPLGLQFRPWATRIRADGERIVLLEKLVRAGAAFASMANIESNEEAAGAEAYIADCIAALAPTKEG